MLVNQMLVAKAEEALPGKPGSGIITVTPDQTVADAAKLLSEHRIGAVVVSEDGRTPLGILSERDIVRELGKRGSDILSQPLADLMTRKLVTCAPGDDALEVLEIMTRGRFRHLPVIDPDGHMIGLISIGDAVSGRLKELAAEKEALTGMIMGN
ncbi:MAG: CBS domain-containing protein [Paracoccus sp. (in: a-proteobacteria)]|nr:CBS domain-containing protein [Paracoccus sp. (in: a-proteobacteria)]